MSKKNLKVAISSIALLSSTFLRAEDALGYESLGTGEEIRESVLEEIAQNDQKTRNEDRKRRRNNDPIEKDQRRERNQGPRRDRDDRGDKSTDEKCGDDSCS